METTYLIIAAVIVAFVALKLFMGAGAKPISAADAKQLVQQGALLVDVRSPHEFASGKIKGAKNIPLPDIGQRIKEFGSTDKPIVLCCQSGARSGMAARALKKAGYTNLYNLGSWQNW